MSVWTLRELEAVSLRAWPGVEETHHGQWCLRSSGGYTRRANSVHPLGDPGADLPDAVRRAVAWFRERAQPAIFKLTVESVPLGLDAHLADADYHVEVPTLVMACEIGGGDERRAALAPEEAPSPVADVRSAPPLPAGFRAAFDEDVPDEWLDAYASWNQRGPESAGLHRAIVERIRPARTFLRLIGPGGRAASIGLAVADPPWVGFFDLVTAPERRGEGLGRALLSRLVSWGTRRGARAAYLQVEEQNEGARRLYGHLGFRNAYTYWYRVAPGATGG